MLMVCSLVVLNIVWFPFCGGALQGEEDLPLSVALMLTKLSYEHVPVRHAELAVTRWRSPTAPHRCLLWSTPL